MNTTKPKIQIKNVKYAAFNSRETHCYSATLYVDGKRWGVVSNDGHGASDNVHPDKGGWDAYGALNNRIKATYPKWGSTFHPEEGDVNDTDLEMVCNHLVNEWLRKREFKKNLRKVCYIKDGGIYTLAAKYKPTPELIADIKAKASWAAGAVFLNDLPEDEAFAAYSKALEIS